jgi:uncharacterized OB-fold protein
MTVGPVDRDDATAEFFDGTAAGRLLLRRCEQGHYSEPAAAQCTTCASLRLEWAAAAGGASLVSWTITRQPDGAATVLVIAELDEGPWLWSQLVGADPAALAAGLRLAVSFARADAEHETVPVFELAR